MSQRIRRCLIPGCKKVKWEGEWIAMIELPGNVLKETFDDKILFTNCFCPLHRPGGKITYKQAVGDKK